MPGLALESVAAPHLLLAGILLGMLLAAPIALIAQARMRYRHLGAQQIVETALAAERGASSARETELARLAAESERRESHAAQLQQALAAERAATAGLRARLEALERSAAEKLQLLEQARAQLSVEFGNLANRIFQEKTDRFARESKATLDLTLSPLRDQLSEFRRRVDEVYSGDTEGRVRLLHELGTLKELNRRMSEEALNLTRALKGESRTQGAWGEVILERVLEESGLNKGREYETQVALRSADGQRRVPDVIVRLPEGRDVVIDSKVSLRDYERYCSAADDAGRAAALKAHGAALRSHVESLAVKDYEGLEGLRTLDFVLVFVPIEAAFLSALEQDAELFRRAYERNIIIVGPSTLLATLRTVQSIWRYERQGRNAEEIARRAGGLHDQFARVLESLDDLGRHLERTHAAYEQTLERFARGRGNLVGRVLKLGKLGAKTRKEIPRSVLAIADLDDDGEDGEEDEGEAAEPAG